MATSDGVSEDTARGPLRGPLTAPSARPEPKVRVIAPPTIDGGTSFYIDLTSIERRTCCLWDRLFGSERHTTLALPGPVGESLFAEVKRDSRGKAEVIFEADAQLDLFASSPRVVLITRSHALWSQGSSAWMTRWFDLASWWLLGQRCETPELAYKLGWRTRNVELAADFTGFSIYDGEGTLFTGKAKPQRCDSHGFKEDGSVETLDLGKRRRNCIAVSTHDKTLRLKDLKQVPADSVYADTWRINGWDGAASIRRVEVRAHGMALCLLAKKGEGSGVDLQVPATLLEQTVLCQYWRHVTQRQRLTLPPTGRDARKRRQETDPRWRVVIEASGVERGPPMAINRSSRMRRSLATLQRGAVLPAVRSVARALGLAGKLPTTENIADLVQTLGAHEEFTRCWQRAQTTRKVRMSLAGSGLLIPDEAPRGE